MNYFKQKFQHTQCKLQYDLLKSLDARIKHRKLIYKNQKYLQKIALNGLQAAHKWSQYRYQDQNVIKDIW